MLRTCVLLLLASTAHAAAQSRSMPLLGFFPRAGLRGAQSYAWQSDGLRRSLLETRFYWLADSTAAVELGAGADLVSARTATGYYRLLGVGGHLRFNRLPFTPLFELDVEDGRGEGPAGLVQLRAKGTGKWLSLELRPTFLSAQSRTDSIVAAYRHATPLRFARQYTDAEATARYTHKRGGVAWTTGARVGAWGDQKAWGYATFDLAFPRAGGIILAAGTQPARPERVQLAGWFARVGLQYSVLLRRRAQPPPPVLSGVMSVHRLANGAYQLVLNAAHAQTVELKGDLTDWETRPLKRVGHDGWFIELEAKPGVYLVNIRIDRGDWVVPAGLVSIDDGFGGVAGLITLR